MHLESASIGGYYVVRTVKVDEPAVNLDLNADGDKVDLQVATPAYLFQENGAGNGLNPTAGEY